MSDIELAPCPFCMEAQELARADKDRRIEIALKMLVTRWPVAEQLSIAGQAALVNAMEDFAQACPASTRSQSERVSRLEEGLKVARTALVSVSGRGFNRWPVVDSIDALLANLPQD